MTKVQIIYWRDIPVQVRLRNGRTRHTQPLSARFQKAVHRAAYRAKAITGDAYVAEWCLSDWQEREGALEVVGTAVVTELEETFSDALLDRLARNKGFKEKDE